MKKDQLLGVSPEGFHQVAYTEWGERDADPALPTVICVHGYSRNSRDFDDLAEYLSLRGRHVFCPDVVGRGDSSWFKHSNNYNFKQYEADMTAMIARTNAHQIDWIGTSMGGMIGMALAALPNSPISHLVLNDVGPQIPVHGLKKLALSQSQTDFKSFDEAKAYFKERYKEFGDLTEKQWTTLTEHSITRQAPNKFVAKLDPGVNNPKSTSQFLTDFFMHPHKSLEGVFYDIDLWSAWKKVHCPVLVIRGSESELLTPEIVKRMQRDHPETYLYEKEGVGHAPALLDEVDHEAIETWLDET